MEKYPVLIMGAGKIGSLIAFLLANSNDYLVYVADTNLESPDLLRINHANLKIISLNIEDTIKTTEFLRSHHIQALISCLPYFYNITAATLAKEFNLHYFDLTEDVATTDAVAQHALGAKNAFVPQCGLAPGFISIVANDLMCHFSRLEWVKMRVGALPLHVSNALQYSLTWSTDGLINEYGKPCQGIENSTVATLQPLEGLEEIKIDGLTYEAFNTSGGIGSLVKTYADKVNLMNYKTIRHPGHCEKMRFLMNDLQLNQDRPTLKRILENALPKTYQDVVLIYVSVGGTQNGQLIEENYVRKFYPKTVGGLSWSAIQLTTACSLSAVFDLVINQQQKYSGLIRQEQFTLEQLTTNRFGQYFVGV